MQLEEQAVRSFLTPLKAHLFQIYPKGKTFYGLINCAPPFDPNTPLGADPREKSILEVNDPPPGVSMNSRIMDLTRNQLWEVLGQIDNNADFANQYIVVQIVAGKDN